MVSSQAVVMNAFGDADVLTLQQVEIPEPAAGEVLLRVLATTVNHLDVDVRDGTSRMDIPLPHVLGREIVGEVVSVGEGVTNASVGERYLVLPNVPCGRCALCVNGRSNLCHAGYLPGISGWGGYAEYARVPASGLVAIGDLPAEVAAATPISFGTAWRMLYVAGRTLPGETVLVVGAAGGLGHAAVQLAKFGGARVIALISTEAKEKFVRECGADEVVLTRAENWPALAADAAGAAGIDVVVEHVGGSVFENIVPLVNETGRILVGGGHGGEHPHLDVIQTFRKELQLIGVRSQRPAEIERVLALAASGAIHPHIDSVRPLAEARDAHEALTARRVQGKQVLIP